MNYFLMDDPNQTTPFECARNGLEFLIGRPLADTEVKAIFDNFDESWLKIKQCLAVKGLRITSDGDKSRLLTGDGEVMGENLFRCLEQYRATHVPDAASDDAPVDNGWDEV